MIAELIKRLRAGDNASRRCAMRELKKRGVVAIPGLIEALRDDHWPVRYHAAAILGAIKHPDAIPALVAVWRDDRETYWKVRERAGLSLVEIGSPAVPALIALMQDKGHGVRRHAATALGNIGDPAALEALTAALYDADKVLHYRAREAIEKITTSDSSTSA